MGKKHKNDIPNPSSISNRDVIQRLNFLYQASVYLHNIHSSSQSTPVSSSSQPVNESTSKKNEGKKSKKKRIVQLNDLSRSYIETMKSVGTKTTVQVDPSVKRTLCKGCNAVLVPGSTASVRTRRSSTHGHIMIYTCSGCKHHSRIPAAPILRPGEEPTASETVAVAMNVDVPQAQTEIQSISQACLSEHQQPNHQIKTRKKKSIQPRLPQLFARDAGHIVFAGNEQLLSSNGSWDDGIYIT
ncbi:RNAse P Rpr2/Rpp21/SNM1 subunit domain-containing protein [Lentinula edodes]|uniref:RNAse P Rpr2/Rpp21/SNM1 subunit domain-containing protein n=1 Tax=Lentinula lateritia TaxID=40482 RepID=A0A9W9E093_9AGAR|nr:RNAse P Rpr2/Rpp21/SNM1 subunit domain-containing protein [Lentinula edodes]